MSMNRVQKRAAQKGGQVNPDGSQTAVRDRKAPTQHLKSERTKPMQFIREVRAELKKVAWPTRDEVRRYSIIVLAALIVFTAFVFGIDFLFERMFRFITDPAAEGALAATVSQVSALVPSGY